jgi:hypothetical protein
MRPIFNPNARTSEVCPFAVGTAARAGEAGSTLPFRVFRAADAVGALVTEEGTTAAIGCDVGTLVASTLPGSPLTAATSLDVPEFLVATVFGTGRVDGFAPAATRGAGASGNSFC